MTSYGHRKINDGKLTNVMETSAIICSNLDSLSLHPGPATEIPDIPNFSDSTREHFQSVQMSDDLHKCGEFNGLKSKGHATRNDIVDDIVDVSTILTLQR